MAIAKKKKKKCARLQSAVSFQKADNHCDIYCEPMIFLKLASGASRLAESIVSQFWSSYSRRQVDVIVICGLPQIPDLPLHQHRTGKMETEATWSRLGVKDLLDQSAWKRDLTFTF